MERFVHVGSLSPDHSKCETVETKGYTKRVNKYKSQESCEFMHILTLTQCTRTYSRTGILCTHTHTCSHTHTHKCTHTYIARVCIPCIHILPGHGSHPHPDQEPYLIAEELWERRTKFERENKISQFVFETLMASSMVTSLGSV